MDRDLITSLGLPLNGPAMIALVGAGGKTTSMMALAQEYKALNRRVLVTTTTRIFVPPSDFSDAVVLGTGGPMLDKPMEKGTITVVGEAVEENGKLVGVLPEWLDKLYLGNLFDIILVEADGSRGKPLKAPASYEPVIPEESTHVIGIIGMDAYGEAMNDRWIHRLEEFLKVTGGIPDQAIDDKILVKLIESPQGLFKNTPVQAKRILLLNKCTGEYRMNAADSLITICMINGIGQIERGARR